MTVLDGRRKSTRGRLAVGTVAFVALLAAAVAPAPVLAQVPEPRVLKQQPYWLSLYEAEGKRRGTVLLIHGGGWRGALGPAADKVMGDWIGGLHVWGYDVANLGYRPGADSLRDALAAFDLFRERVGSGERLCIFGVSAGAQLGLTVAAQRGDEVDCVVDLLGPPDLVDWGSRPASRAGLRLATRAFGKNRLASLSPINFVERIQSPVLVAAARCDPFIELGAQRRFVEELNAAGGDAFLQVVATGDEVPLGHCAVSKASFDQLRRETRRFLAGEFRTAAVEPGDEESGPDVPLILAGAVVLAGFAMLMWAVKRRA